MTLDPRQTQPTVVREEAISPDPATAPAAPARPATAVRQGRIVGVWRILAASLVLVIIGFALVALFV